jgi:hypothetical protein
LNKLLNKILVAARVITDRGRWPGQSNIMGAAPRPQSVAHARPLRWPGQHRITPTETRRDVPIIPPRSLWFFLFDNFTNRKDNAGNQIQLSFK